MQLGEDEYLGLGPHMVRECITMTSASEGPVSLNKR